MIATHRVIFLQATASACLLLTAAIGQAANFNIIDGEGFEAPAYSTTLLGSGQLEGQFASTDGGFGSDQWAQTPIGGTGTAVVQDSVVASGSQAVRVDRAANSDDSWGVRVDGYPHERFICIEWDMNVVQTPSTTGFGPLFGMEAYDYEGSALRFGLLGVDASTGDVLATVPGNLVETGVLVNFDEWNSYRMILDFVDGTYYGFLNGTEIFSSPFEFAGATEFTDAAIAALAAGADPVSQGLTGTAYFDNYLVFETSVNKIPEPTTLAVVLGIAGIAVATRQRV